MNRPPPHLQHQQQHVRPVPFNFQEVSPMRQRPIGRSFENGPAPNRPQPQQQYYHPQQQQQQPPFIQQRNQGDTEIGGVGIVFIDSDDGSRVVVRNVVENSPAWENGAIRDGDILSSINGISAFGKNLRDIKELIVGPIGTSCELEFERPGGPYGKRYTILLARRNNYGVNARPPSAPSTAFIPPEINFESRNREMRDSPSGSNRGGGGDRYVNTGNQDFEKGGGTPGSSNRGNLNFGKGRSPVPSNRGNTNSNTPGGSLRGNPNISDFESPLISAAPPMSMMPPPISRSPPRSRTPPPLTVRELSDAAEYERAEREKLQRKVQEMENERHTLLWERERAERAAEESRRDVDTLRRDLDEERGRAQQFIDGRERVEREIHALQNDNESLRAKIAADESNRETSNIFTGQRLAEIQAERDSLSREVQVWKDRAAELQSEIKIQKNSAANSPTGQMYNSLRIQIRELEGEIRTVRMERDTLQRERASLTQSRDAEAVANRDRVLALQRENGYLKGTLVDQQGDRDKIVADLSSRCELMEEGCRRLPGLQKNIEHLSHQNKLLIEDNHTLKRELDICQVKLDDALAECRSLAVVSKAEKEHMDMAHRIASTQLEREIEVTHRQLDHVAVSAEQQKNSLIQKILELENFVHKQNTQMVHLQEELEKTKYSNATSSSHIHTLASVLMGTTNQMQNSLVEMKMAQNAVLSTLQPFSSRIRDRDPPLFSTPTSRFDTGNFSSPAQLSQRGLLSSTPNLAIANGPPASGRSTPTFTTPRVAKA